MNVEKSLVIHIKVLELTSPGECRITFSYEHYRRGHGNLGTRHYIAR